MAFNSLDKKFSPGFAIPKVPPVGETLLDQSCPIARGITLLVAGGALGKNKAIGGSDAITTKATRRGPYLEFDGTSDTLRFDNVYTSADIASTGMTQLVRFRLLGGVFPASSDSLTQGTTTISNNPPAGGINFNVGGNVQLTGRIYNGSAYVDVAAPSGKFLDQLPGGLYQWLTVAIVADPVADTFTLWQQGDPADQTTSAGLSGANFNADKFFLASQYDSNSYPNVEVQLCATWNRALSDAEMVSLYRDPFQLLKPATQPGYFTPSVASGNFTLTAASGSYSISGTAASLVSARSLAADTGSYSYTGTSADLNLGRSLAADSGSYSYTGTAATLTFASAGNFTLTADTGAYVVSGTAASLTLGALLTGASGTYNVSGTAVSLNRGYNLSADSGSYTYTGTNTALSVTVTLVAESGAYTYNGSTATFNFSGQVWTVQSDSASLWSEQTDTTTTWDIK